VPTSRSGSVRLALTIGDPAGIGPEVLVKALNAWPKRGSVPVLILGGAFLLNALSRKFRLALRFADVPSLEGWERHTDAVPCFFTGNAPSALPRGRSQKALTVAAVRSIELAAHAAMDGRADAVVTPPINKAALKKAGFDIPGHTEFLAKLAGVKNFEMMLSGGPLRVVLVTRHQALKHVPALATKKRVEDCIDLTVQELKRSFGIARPRVAVCGLNPHAGEEGTIGLEEIKVIGPAVRASRRRNPGAEIIGPIAPDTLFIDAYRGKYDAEICMYHDQGLIPLKMISRGRGVNVTLGLPFVRTSPDHGTAYDIAGKGTADPGSMMEALDMAFELARARR
jgi:4-hydroxythreonine-4-phosphate dehydrogenase